MGLFTYVRVSVASVFQKQGRRALLLCGVFMQAGSLIGAVTIFVLVTVFKVFRDMPPCGFQ